MKILFREKGIRRRPIAEIRIDHNDVRQAVQVELSGSASGIGYRRMHRTLKSKGLLCRRDDIRVRPSCTAKKTEKNTSLEML